MSHFLFSPGWSAYGWAAQLIATIFVKYMKSNILSISVGVIKLAKHSIWHYPDKSIKPSGKWNCFCNKQYSNWKLSFFSPQENLKLSTFFISPGRNEYLSNKEKGITGVSFFSVNYIQWRKIVKQSLKFKPKFL